MLGSVHELISQCIESCGIHLHSFPLKTYNGDSAHLLPNWQYDQMRYRCETNSMEIGIIYFFNFSFLSRSSFIITCYILMVKIKLLHIDMTSNIWVKHNSKEEEYIKILLIVSVAFNSAYINIITRMICNVFDYNEKCKLVEV